MFKKLILPIVVLAALSAAGYLWWQAGPKLPEGPETTGLEMVVAKYYWPGEYWIEIADKKGWFKEAGLNVVFVDTNPDYYKSIEDMAAGKLDVNNLPLFALMRFNMKGKSLVMVVNSDQSWGAEALVVQSEIESIQGLKGKSVGVSADTYTEYILDVVLERSGLLPSDIIKVDILEEQAANDFTEHKVDAIITWEPFVTLALKGRTGRKLFNTAEIPGISPNGQVFHRSFIEERPGDVQAYVNVWYRTTQFIKENPTEAFAIIAEIYGVTPGEVEAFAEQDTILDLQDNLKAFTYGVGFESLHGTAREINNFMIEKGITDKQLDSTEFLDPQFIRAVREELVR
jgi:NitT/TauT family transport system substrate-binding protein